MITQHFISWSCPYCKNHHKYLSDTIDIPTEKYNVKCTKCGKTHKLRVFTNQLSDNAYCEVSTGIEEQNDLQYFIDFQIPFIPSRKTIKLYKKENNDSLTVDQILQAWSEHDALHYLSGKLFSHEDEEYIAHLEREFNCGWFPHGESRNSFLVHPKKLHCPHITQKLIMETADLILNYIE